MTDLRVSNACPTLRKNHGSAWFFDPGKPRSYAGLRNSIYGALLTLTPSFAGPNPAIPTKKKPVTMRVRWLFYFFLFGHKVSACPVVSSATRWGLTFPGSHCMLCSGRAAWEKWVTTPARHGGYLGCITGIGRKGRTYTLALLPAQNKKNRAGDHPRPFCVISPVEF